MTPSVLIVDSDGKALAALQRKLRKEFDAQIALGPRMGLQRMNEDGPYAVVIAEYSMQQMDGVSFLQKIQSNWPDTTRILVARSMMEATDLIRCINDAKAFHILANPCSDEMLFQVVSSAVAHYEKITAHTQEMRVQHARIAKAVHAIISWLREDVRDLISAALPIMRALSGVLKDPAPLVTETALLISIVGMISLPQRILQKRSGGVALDKEEQLLFNKHPDNAAEFFMPITQLTEVLVLLRYYSNFLSGNLTEHRGDIEEGKVLGAMIMALVMEYRYASLYCHDLATIMERLRANPLGFPNNQIRALEEIIYNLDEAEDAISLEEARAGMVLAQPVIGIRDGHEVDLVPKGYELSRTTLVFLRQSAKHSVVREPLYVRKKAL